ncbi:MAG: DMT family transporter [Sphingomonas bacterium]|nr:DMT family transporter [Sphingomonas bacterium]
MSGVEPSRIAVAVGAVGIAIYAGMDAVMKGLSIASGAYSAVLWRSLAGVLIAGSVFLARRRRWPRGAALRLHIARGTLAGSSVLLFFWGLARVPMAKAIALTFLAPVIAIFLAAWMLGERIRPYAMLGAAMSAIGVIVIAAGEISRDASTDSVLGNIAIVIASVLYAGNLVLLRRQAQGADPLEVTLLTSLVISTLLMVGAPWFSGWPDWPQVPVIGFAGTLGTISSLLMAWAYARAETQVLATIEYSAFVWAGVLGYLVFGEVVTLFTVTGAVLIVAGCLIAVRKPIPLPQTEAAL